LRSVRSAWCVPACPWRVRGCVCAWVLCVRACKPVGAPLRPTNGVLPPLSQPANALADGPAALHHPPPPNYHHNPPAVRRAQPTLLFSLSHTQTHTHTYTQHTLNLLQGARSAVAGRRSRGPPHGRLPGLGIAGPGREDDGMRQASVCFQGRSSVGRRGVAGVGGRGLVCWWWYGTERGIVALATPTGPVASGGSGGRSGDDDVSGRYGGFVVVQWVPGGPAGSTAPACVRTLLRFFFLLSRSPGTSLPPDASRATSVWATSARTSLVSTSRGWPAAHNFGSW
jgi:hypothetical protein